MLNNDHGGCAVRDTDRSPWLPATPAFCQPEFPRRVSRRSRRASAFGGPGVESVTADSCRRTACCSSGCRREADNWSRLRRKGGLRRVQNGYRTSMCPARATTTASPLGTTHWYRRARSACEAFMFAEARFRTPWVDDEFAATISAGRAVAEREPLPGRASRQAFLQNAWCLRRNDECDRRSRDGVAPGHRAACRSAQSLGNSNSGVRGNSDGISRVAGTTRVS